MTRSIPTTFLVALAAAFAALQVVLGTASLDDNSEPGASAGGMVVYAVLMTLALLPRPRRLPKATAWTIVAGSGLITLLVQSGLSRSEWPGYAAWHPAALQCLLIVLAVRGRPMFAAAGCALFSAGTIVWSLTTQPGIVEGLRICLAPVLFVATAIALGRFLAMNDRRAESKTRQSLTLLNEAARAKARTVEAAAWVGEVRDVAAPSLMCAADPNRDLDAGDRERMLEAEAVLRDRVRGGSMATGPILRLIAEVRSRGVIAHLLDDRGALITPSELAALEDRLAAVAGRIDSPGVLTVRARPFGNYPNITIVFAPDGEGEALYVEL